MRNILIPITIAVMLSLSVLGCGEDFESPEWLQWKWGKKETPTTSPTEVLVTEDSDVPAEQADVVTDDAAAAEMFEAQLAAADPITVGPHPSQLPQPLGTRSDWPEGSFDDSAEPAEEATDLDEPPTPADVAAEIDARRAAGEPDDDWTGPEIDDDLDLDMDVEEQPVVEELEEPIEEPVEEPIEEPVEEPVEEDATSMDIDEPDMSAILLDDISLDDDGPAESSPVTADPGDLVAASLVQVNDEFITVDDVLRGLHPQFVAMPPVASESDFRRHAASMIHGELQRQVVEALVLAEAEAAMTDRQETFIDQEMEQRLRTMIAEAGGSQQVLEQQCRQRYTTLDEILDDQRNQLVFHSYLQQIIEPDIIINPQMLLDYYRQHPEEFSEKSKIQMQLIALPFEAFLPDSDTTPTDQDWQLARARARAEADRALADLRSGIDFGKVAETRSRGPKRDEAGIWPLMTEGSFREEEVQANAFRLSSGEICGPIRTETGNYIVRTLQIVPGRTVPYEEAQQEIEQRLRQEQSDRLMGEYFVGLQKRATLSESEQFMATALDRATQRYWTP